MIRQLQCETARRSQKEVLKRDGQAAAMRDSQATAGAGKREMPNLKICGQAAACDSQATAEAQEARRCCCKIRAAGTSLERTANKDKTRQK